MYRARLPICVCACLFVRLRIQLSLSPTRRGPGGGTSIRPVRSRCIPPAAPAPTAVVARSTMTTTAAAAGRTTLNPAARHSTVQAEAAMDPGHTWLVVEAPLADRTALALADALPAAARISAAAQAAPLRLREGHTAAAAPAVVHRRGRRPLAAVQVGVGHTPRAAARQRGPGPPAPVQVGAGRTRRGVAANSAGVRRKGHTLLLEAGRTARQVPASTRARQGAGRIARATHHHAARGPSAGRAVQTATHQGHTCLTMTTSVQKVHTEHLGTGPAAEHAGSVRRELPHRHRASQQRHQGQDQQAHPAAAHRRRRSCPRHTHRPGVGRSCGVTAAAGHSQPSRVAVQAASAARPTVAHTQKWKPARSTRTADACSRAMGRPLVRYRNRETKQLAARTRSAEAPLLLAQLRPLHWVVHRTAGMAGSAPAPAKVRGIRTRSWHTPTVALEQSIPLLAEAALTAPPLKQKQALALWGGVELAVPRQRRLLASPERALAEESLRCAPKAP
jgi:hypothetical protein